MTVRFPACPRATGAAALVVALGCVASPALAAVVIDSGDPNDPTDDLVLDIRASVGTGLFNSYLVVDFGATGGGAYAYQWNWNPGDDARGATMLEALIDGTDLEASIGGEDGVGFGIFIENFTLPAAGEAGDPDNFWAYWNAEAEDVDPGVAWSFASVGASDRILEHGSIDGWYNGFDGTTPAVPVTQVPGPAAGLVLLGLTGRGRRRRD